MSNRLKIAILAGVFGMGASGCATYVPLENGVPLENAVARTLEVKPVADHVASQAFSSANGPFNVSVPRQQTIIVGTGPDGKERVCFDVVDTEKGPSFTAILPEDANDNYLATETVAINTYVKPMVKPVEEKAADSYRENVGKVIGAACLMPR